MFKVCLFEVAMSCNLKLESAVSCFLVFFFFQAEDGIRDLTVTGVQTCALPISGTGYYVYDNGLGIRIAEKKTDVAAMLRKLLGIEPGTDMESLFRSAIGVPQGRSEERRVGKECRSRWSPYH